MKPLVKTLVWLTLFSIAMGFLETAVVVYLRELYYPDGFKFPLIPIKPSIAITEFCREAATIIMLAGIGMLTGRSRTEKFGFFIYCFAIWDIFYYVFLKALIGWPESFFTWDILFLIPVPWVGPVLAPVIVSLSMILLAMLVVYYEEKKITTKFSLQENIMMMCGCLIIIVSFLIDYIRYTSTHSSAVWNVASEKSLFEEVSHYVPTYYNWGMFWTGELLLLAGMILFTQRMKKLQTPLQ